MMERLVDISERIDNMRQLGAVVTAMRGIAAARVQKSRNVIMGIEAYTATISAAIGQAMNLVPAGTETPSLAGRAASVLFCAEQGFAGAFSDRVLDEVLEGLKPEHLAGRSLLIVGTRGAAIAEQRGLAAAWSAAMANQIANVPELANRLADVLYGRIATEGISDVEVVFSAVDDEHKLTVRRRKLLPISLERFKRPMPALPPLTNLAPAQLLPKLVEEFVYAALCEAAVQSFAAENAARLQAMSAAGDNVDRMLGELFQREREVRQEEITAEIVELAAEVEAAS